MENTCIYWKSDADLTFNKKEHVFPAGIGCKTTLPKGYVSDKANEETSILEAELLRETLALPRIFEGPGKRGSLSVEKQTKSDVCIAVDELDEVQLAYISLGKPYPIIQIHKRGILLSVSSPNQNIDYDTKPIIDDLFNRLETFHNPFVFIESKRLKEGECIFGFYNNKQYYAAKTKQTLERIKDQINEIKSIKNSFEQAFLSPKSSHISCDMFFIMTERTNRAVAKIACNTAAYCFGNTFLLNPCFDDIRSYIVEGTKTTDYVSFVQIVDIKNEIDLMPHKSHWCLITKYGMNLIAVVCFYNHFAFQVLLSDCCHTNVQPNGFICDWKRKKDYKLYEFLSLLSSDEKNEISKQNRVPFEPST